MVEKIGARLRAQGTREEMNIVIYCEHRAQRGAGGVICPGGNWTCTNPKGHCSCVEMCGVITKLHFNFYLMPGVNYESDKGQRREVHILLA